MFSRILGNLLFIGRCLNTFQRQVPVDTELIPSQNILISYICRYPGCTAEDLIREYGLHKSRVARLMTVLEEGGYVTRAVSEKDARCRLLYPTEKALSIHPQLEAQYEFYTDEILTGLSAEETEALQNLTERIRENAAKLIDNAK
ncbi:MAG: MarR family winged helix-turn-helix transcriptional regulator [Christensenellales bacterium]|jgi:DNA-binding MarR family transcriptional regulator